MNILVDASLPGLDAAFPKPFKVTRYQDEAELSALLADHNGLVCRSTLKVNQALLEHTQLDFVATASSGIDHIDQEYFAKNAIQLIDAKGCNASSVADYVLASVAYLTQHYLVPGKTAGIIGLGKVGTEVYTRLRHLGFEILTYDPPRAERDTQFKSCTLEQLFACDVLCLHAELHDSVKHPTLNLIDSHFLANLNPNTVLINAARGGIINEEALLNSTNPLVYCTDVYLKEPDIHRGIVDKATLCTPHIAGHSLEAKFMAVELVSRKIHQLYNLSVPVYQKPLFSESSDSYTTTGQILSIYNPIVETMMLKQARDLRAEFLAVRKSHNKRHDFAHYLGSVS